MQIKQFEGTSMEEILARVKKTLGEDALILSTRKSTKKRMGAFTEAVYEVSAAVDRSARPATVPAARGRYLDTVAGPEPAAPAATRPADGPKEPAGTDAPPAPAAPKATPFEAFLSLEKELAPLKEEIASLKSFLSTVLAERAASADHGQRERLDRLADDVRSMRERLERGLTAAVAPAAAGEPAVPAARETGDAGEDWLVRRLLAQGLGEPASRRIRKAVAERLPSDRRTDEEIRRVAGAVIASAVRTADMPAPAAAGPRVLAFVGPAGAGKTAAVARVGRLLAGKGFRLATVSVEAAPAGSLRLHRDLGGLGIPALSARNGEELARAVATCYGAHYILVDTAGDGCTSREAVARLAAVFRGRADVEFCLTLPADWEGESAGRLAENLAPLPVRYTTFTGIDRARTYGPMFRAAATAGRPVLYLTADDRAGGAFPARPYMFSRLLLDRTIPEERTAR